MVWSCITPFADSSSLVTEPSSVATKFYRSVESSATSTASRTVSQLPKQQENRDDASNCPSVSNTSLVNTKRSQTFQVDYNKCCTPLFKKIEQQDWDDVGFFLDNHHWRSEFFADWRYADQVRTWVTHFDSGTGGGAIQQNGIDKTGWSILPLHFALRLKAPCSIIVALVENYPESIHCTDDRNLLPIHLAVRHGCSNDVVDYLFRTFPDAIIRKCKENQDLTSLDCKILRHEMVRKRMRILYPGMNEETRSVVMGVLDGEESKATLDEVSRSRSKVTGAYDFAGTESTTSRNSITRSRECSYELDCIPLFKQIESREWTAIDQFLVSGYWPGSFFIDKLSPAVQACTYVTRFDPDLPNHVRWSMLPLHMAVILDAPFATIEKLIEIYQSAVHSTDDQGYFPLHLAMLHGRSNQVLDFLFRAYPEALDQKAGKYKLSPLDCAMVGKDSVRARILGAFVKKSQDEATKAVASLVSEQISDLRVTIEEKKREMINKQGGFLSNKDMSRVFHEVTEKIKQCEHVTRQLQNRGIQKPSMKRGESNSSRSTHAESSAASARQWRVERSKRPQSILRHTTSALSGVLRRVPGSSNSTGTGSVSTDANSLLA